MNRNSDLSVQLSVIAADVGASMSNKSLVRLLLPALLLAAAAVVWFAWSQNGQEAQQAELPHGVSLGLLGLAGLAALRSILDDVFDLPLGFWFVAALIVVLAVAFFFSPAVTVFGGLALLALLTAFYLS
jgi:hypothetical protein